MTKFAKATKKAARLRLALIGPSGSGKTYSALALAAHLGQRVAVVDTERGSASKYADVFGFDVLELETFEPARYVDAIKSAEAEGYDVIVVDSLSHAWMGRGGALEMADNIAKRSQSGNKFNAWRDVTPAHNALVDAIIGSRAHVIATMRAKTEYVLEEDHRGKKVPRKVGLAPVQRDGLEYEFDVVGTLDLDNNLIVDKTRCPSIAGKVYPKPGKEFAGLLSAWLSDGVQPVERHPLAERAEEAAAGVVLSEADTIASLIGLAESKEQLTSLVPRIKRLPTAEQDAIRAAYKARSAELGAS